MNTYLRNLFCIVGLTVVCLAVGCGNKEATDETAVPAEGTADAAAQPAAGGLPGAQEAMAALDKKDYDAAIAAVVQARQSVTTTEQQNQFTDLVDNVRIRLIDEAPTDPNAQKALAVLRQITGGR
jgi:hypothetical protein